MEKRPKNRQKKDEKRPDFKLPKRGIARLPEEEEMEKDRHKRKRLR